LKSLIATGPLPLPLSSLVVESRGELPSKAYKPILKWAIVRARSQDDSNFLPSTRNASLFWNRLTHSYAWAWFWLFRFRLFWKLNQTLLRNSRLSPLSNCLLSAPEAWKTRTFPTMNIFRLIADLMHLASIMILFLKIDKTKSAAGWSSLDELRAAKRWNRDVGTLWNRSFILEHWERRTKATHNLCRALSLETMRFEAQNLKWREWNQQLIISDYLGQSSRLQESRSNPNVYTSPCFARDILIFSPRSFRSITPG
jgi:hypothetical protein